MRRQLALLCLAGAATSATVALAIEPLSTSDNGRFLVDSQGQPVYLLGDSAWSLMTAIPLNEAENYIQDRADRGFNGLIVNLIEHFFNGPLNAAGQHPFLNPSNPDFTQLNDAYFDHAESVVAAAQDRGVYILLYPAYLGSDSQQGWWNEVNANGDTKMRQYGRLIGERFKDYDNIIWVAGGDRPPDGATSETFAMIEGILEKDSSGNLFTAHSNRGASPAVNYGNEPWFTVSNAYTNGVSYSGVLDEINLSPIRPVFLIEDSYENEGGGAYDQRRAKWWAATSGTTGVIMGNNPIWLFDPGWENELSSPLSQDMQRLGEFMRSVPWYKLMPDNEHNVVTSGFNIFGSEDYVTASFDNYGSFLLAYLPVGGTITIDLSRFSDSIDFEWFDPTSGVIVDAGAYDNVGNKTFTIPGMNSAAAPDWVFVGQTVGVPGDFDNNQSVNGVDFLMWQRGHSSNPLSAGDLQEWRSNYGLDSLGLPGDFDNNQVVDGADYLMWQRGQSPRPLSAADLELWKANYGRSNLSEFTTIPEPKSHVLVLILILLVGSLLSVRCWLTLKVRSPGKAN